MDIYNMFNEEEDFIGHKFSSVLLFVFLYYSLSYYFLLNENGCLKKPHISYVVIMLILHIIHIILLKFFHTREEHMYMWIVAIVPLLLYLIYSKYQSHISKKDEERKAALYAQLKAEQDSNTEQFRNAKPTGPNAPPMGGQQYVGLQQKGGNLPFHQQQHNNPMPPQNPPSSMTQLPAIAHQGGGMTDMFSNNRALSNMSQDMQYDAGSVNSYRTNNTVSEPIQQVQQLDMLAIGNNAGSGGLSGFDPFGSSFGSF